VEVLEMMLTVSDYGRPYLIIPWVVLQELDAMKGSRFKVGLPLEVFFCFALSSFA